MTDPCKLFAPSSGAQKLFRALASTDDYIPREELLAVSGLNPNSFGVTLHRLRATLAAEAPEYRIISTRPKGKESISHSYRLVCDSARTRPTPNSDGMSLVCPVCASVRHSVVETRAHRGTNRRRRSCRNCGFRFYTAEIVCTVNCDDPDTGRPIKNDRARRASKHS